MYSLHGVKMRFIEFIGSLGVGKSTIHSKLISHENLWGGTEEDALKRNFFREETQKYQILFRVLPRPLQSTIENKILKDRYSNAAFTEFVVENPDFLKLMERSLKRVSKEQPNTEKNKNSSVRPDKVVSWLKQTAESYQLSISMKKEDELLILDEGFCQRAHSLLWRYNTSPFSLREYFQIVPIPQILIHLDASAEICYSRQNERKDITYKSHKLDIIEESRQICFEITDYLKSNHDTKVIYVENTGTIIESVEKIKRSYKVRS